MRLFRFIYSYIDLNKQETLKNDRTCYEALEEYI